MQRAKIPHQTTPPATRAASADQHGTHRGRNRYHPSTHTTKDEVPGSCPGNSPAPKNTARHGSAGAQGLAFHTDAFATTTLKRHHRGSGAFTALGRTARPRWRGQAPRCGAGLWQRGPLVTAVAGRAYSAEGGCGAPSCLLRVLQAGASVPTESCWAAKSATAGTLVVVRWGETRAHCGASRRTRPRF